MSVYNIVCDIFIYIYIYSRIYICIYIYICRDTYHVRTYTYVYVYCMLYRIYGCMICAIFFIYIDASVHIYIYV